MELSNFVASKTRYTHAYSYGEIFGIRSMRAMPIDQNHFKVIHRHTKRKDMTKETENFVLKLNLPKARYPNSFFLVIRFCWFLCGVCFFSFVFFFC